MKARYGFRNRARSQPEKIDLSVFKSAESLGNSVAAKLNGKGLIQWYCPYCRATRRMDIENLNEYYDLYQPLLFRHMIPAVLIVVAVTVGSVVLMSKFL